MGGLTVLIAVWREGLIGLAFVDCFIVVSLLSKVRSAVTNTDNQWPLG